MAFDTYMQFKDSKGNWLSGESQVVISSDTPLGTDIQQGAVFEIDDFSFDVEQVLNIGSSSSGAGAGKITFNPFQITRKTDRASPKLFMMCCTGEHFQVVSLYLRRAGGMGGITGAATASSGFTFLRYDFALVAVKTISWSGSDGDEAMKEEVTFEYGALQVQYCQQNTDGTPNQQGKTIGSWNRVNNNAQFSLAGISLTAATGKS
jgi:type VI secretion system secreted protein Hcp